MTLPRVTVFLGLSLDGYLAREDHALDWLSLVHTDPPEDTGYTALMTSVDVLVMGRQTYDAALTFPAWPFAGKRVVVLTHRTLEPKHGEEVFQGSLKHLLEQLGREGHQHVYLDGGNVVRQGLESGLVSDMTLSWVPVVLGSGIALFDRSLPEQRWTLTNGHIFPSGLVQATYRVSLP